VQNQVFIAFASLLVQVILRDPALRTETPLKLVDIALDRCKRDGNVFWGQGSEVYIRRRGAKDAILNFYYADLAFERGVVAVHKQP
jgi:hypothetical protein